MLLLGELHKVRPKNKWITCVRRATSRGGRAELYELLLLHGFLHFRTCFRPHPSCKKAS